MLLILVAIPRHSPTCADAIIKCPRLVHIVVNRFTMKDQMEMDLSKIKSVTLLKVSIFLFLLSILVSIISSLIRQTYDNRFCLLISKRYWLGMRRRIV